jgi:hypothetical protein
MLLGLVLAICGLSMVGASLSAAMLHYTLPSSNVVVAAFALVLLVIGLIIVLTEVFEKWLTRSQAALVDGLQAG